MFEPKHGSSERFRSNECVSAHVLGMVGCMTESACPSCGWGSTTGTDGVEPPFPASPACYSAYLELSAYNAERARWDFLHQEAVDAYAAQHPVRQPSRSASGLRSSGCTLPSIKDEPVGRFQRARMRLGRHKHAWPRLRAPSDLRCTTVGEVIRHSPCGDRDAAIVRRAGDVWSVWADSHDLIAELCTDRGL